MFKQNRNSTLKHPSYLKGQYNSVYKCNPTKDPLHSCSDDPTCRRIHQDDVEALDDKKMSSRHMIKTYLIFCHLAPERLSNKSAISR